MSNSSSSDKTLEFLLGALIGGAAGVLVGMLYAPKKGTELQEEAREFIDSLPDRLDDEMAPDSKTRKWLDKTRYKLEDRIDRYQNQRSARQERDAKEREAAASGSEYLP